MSYTHTQGKTTVAPDVLVTITRLSALSVPGVSRMANVTVVTMTEFGRRARENASRGTDHGAGSLMLLMGGGVVGRRVYRDWPGLADANLFNGDLEVTTDYRTVLAEILDKRMGGTDLAKVFPGFQATSSLGALLRAVAAQDRVSPGYGNVVGQDIGPSPGFAPVAPSRASSFSTPYAAPAPTEPPTRASASVSQSRRPRIAKRRKPSAFNIAISVARSRMPIEAVFAVMITTDATTRNPTAMITFMSPESELMKLWKNDFSVSLAVSASLLRKRSSIRRITVGTFTGSSTRTQIMPA